jgi:hypothetical protein
MKLIIQRLGQVRLTLNSLYQDQEFAKMSFNEWGSVLSPKVTGTWNVHQAVDQIDLEFFVVFSSISGICGNIGQANYAAANTFIDSFAQYRVQKGLSCSSLALGAVEDVGIFSRDPNLVRASRSGSRHLLNEGELVEGLEAAIRQSTASNPSPIIVGLNNTKHSSEPGVHLAWVSDMRYAMYFNTEPKEGKQTVVSNDHIKDLLARVEENPSLLDEPETERTIRLDLANLITQHMPNAARLDDEEKARIAIDSLMSIEIRGWARRNLGLEISLAEITKAGTIGNLGGVVMEHLRTKYCAK